MATIMNINSLQLLQLLQLTSPSLPVGGFAWSQGLEGAIEKHWLKNETDFGDWLQGILQHSFVWQEWPLLIRLYRAADQNNQAQLEYWNAVSLALRESAELRQEDMQMGAALLRLITDLDYAQARRWQSANTSYVTAFALAAEEKRVPMDAACIGFAWSWLENQIAAALKLFPLGQTAGQRVFQRLVDSLPELFTQAQLVQDDEVGISLPGVAMASMMHEDQYSRLFRS
jgi:urease accessory protein